MKLRLITEGFGAGTFFLISDGVMAARTLFQLLPLSLTGFSVVIAVGLVMHGLLLLMKSRLPRP